MAAIIAEMQMEVLIIYLVKDRHVSEHQQCSLWYTVFIEHKLWNAVGELTIWNMINQHTARKASAL